MKLISFFRNLIFILAAICGWCSSRSWAQSGGTMGYIQNGSQYMTVLVFKTGPEASLQTAGGLNFKVPIERAGHTFYFSYKTSATSSTFVGSMGGVGLVSAGAGGASAAIQYLAVSGPFPSGV
jgi:hypothetical protein